MMIPIPSYLLHFWWGQYTLFANPRGGSTRPFLMQRSGGILYDLRRRFWA